MCEQKPARVSDLRVVFVQDADTCDDNTDVQEIEVHAVDMGDGHFFRIQTERWAVDDAKDFAALLKRVKQMLGR